MWDSDNFPGADNVPWQLLIRARFAHEIDAILASVVVARVGAVASVDITRQVAAVAQGVIAAERGEGDRGHQGAGTVRRRRVRRLVVRHAVAAALAAEAARRLRRLQ